MTSQFITESTQPDESDIRKSKCKRFLEVSFQMKNETILQVPANESTPQFQKAEDSNRNWKVCFLCNKPKKRLI